MLLDALVQASAEDDRVGVSFVSSARNALPFIEAGNEQSIWADVVSEVEKRIDARAEREWATPSSITVPVVNFEVPSIAASKVKAAQVNRDQLKLKMRAAAGPQFNSPQGVTGTNGNPHWPQANGPWVAEFGERMGEAIAEVIESAADNTAIEQPNLTEPLQGLVGAVVGHVDATLRAVSDATSGLQRRTNLLWWKEALFSPSARVSYRDLPLPVSATLMAFDLHQQVPSFSPASVWAFLSETVAASRIWIGRRLTRCMKSLPRLKHIGAFPSFETSPPALLIRPPVGVPWLRLLLIRARMVLGLNRIFADLPECRPRFRLLCLIGRHGFFAS